MKERNSKGGRFAIFCRVSTRDQLNGYSLDLQQQQAKDYVKRAGGTVAKVYSDQESATRKDRIHLQRLLADADSGLFDALVIQDTTRLSRNLSVMMGITEKLLEAGISLHDFNGPIPIETPEGEFTAHIHALIGRFSARQAAKKSIKSREHVLRSGGIAAGRPPFGRRWNKQLKKLEVIPERLDLMRRAYDLIVGKRYSLTRAASQLQLGSTSLRKAIRSAALVEITQHLSGQEYKIPCPPLLTLQEQKRMEQRLAANTIVRPETKGEYLLQGLVRCSHCNGTMTGQTSTKDGRSYAVYRHPLPKSGVKLALGCTWQVPVKLLDDDVLAACANVVKDGESLQNAMRAAIAQASSGEAELATRAAEVEHQAARTQKRLNGLLETLVDLSTKGPARERVLSQIKQAEKTLEEQREEHAQLASQLKVVKLPKGGADAIAAKLRTLYWRHGSGLRTLSFGQRREFVRIIVGRTSRHSSEGVYVKMGRPKGGNKKNVFWKYRLEGSVAGVENYIDPIPENVYSPDIRSRVPTPEQVRQLAAIANSSTGLKKRDMHFGMKYSSGGSRRCG